MNDVSNLKPDTLLVVHWATAATILNEDFEHSSEKIRYIFKVKI